MERASVQGVIPIDGSGDTYATATTFKESLAAVGAGLSLVDSVVAASKITKNPPVGFALIRPPGHHAIPKGPMGFCFFGNVVIAARYAQQAHGLKRVFSIDFDVHHGNGTGDAFYDDPDIFFLSTHQVPPLLGLFYATVGLLQLFLDDKFLPKPPEDGFNKVLATLIALVLFLDLSTAYILFAGDELIWLAVDRLK